MSSTLQGFSLVGELLQLRHRTIFECETLPVVFTTIGLALMLACQIRPLALQQTLYAIPSEWRRIKRSLDRFGPDLIYIDMIRLAPLIPYLRRWFPNAKILFDMDDLMSRRLRLTMRSGSTLSLGYMSDQIPSLLTKLWRSEFLSSPLMKYEAFALACSEKSALRWSDGVVLVSSVEAGELARAAASVPDISKRVFCILPPVENQHIPAPAPIRALTRFVFVGSDRLLQNALAIDWLVQTWKDTRPNLELWIIGSQSRHYEDVQGVNRLGFVENISRIYIPGTILLSPSFIQGGIKTKVLEAFSFGCAVAGNTATFEGLDIPGYPLAFEENDLKGFVAHPNGYIDRINEAALKGWRFVTENATYERHQRQWQQLALALVKGTSKMSHDA